MFILWVLFDETYIRNGYVYYILRSGKLLALIFHILFIFVLKD